MSQDINVLALVKGVERYVFLYSDSHRAETLRTLGRYASDPDLSFTWYDAAVLSQKIRQQSQAQQLPHQLWALAEDDPETCPDLAELMEEHQNMLEREAEGAAGLL